MTRCDGVYCTMTDVCGRKSQSFESDHKRIYHHNIHFSVCQCCLLIILVIIFEICLGLFGPCANSFICFFYTVVKNVMVVQFTAQFAAISIAKYKYIFVHKNPIGNYDGFWCFYFNLNIGLLNFISQFVYQTIPGKKSYLYYICSDKNPLPTDQRKINYFYQFVFIATVTIYFIVECKVKFFKQNDLVVPFTATNNASNWLAKTLRSSLANVLILALILLSLASASALSIVLNNIEPEKLTLSPYYHLVQVHIHLLPLTCGVFLAGTFYVNNVKLRQAVYREGKSWLSQFVG